MKTWSESLRLYSVLATIRMFLAHSKEEGWGEQDPEKTMSDIDQIIAALYYDDNRGLPQHWRILFCATGPLQEIAMANGWSEDFLLLSKEYDSVEHLLKDYKQKFQP